MIATQLPPSASATGRTERGNEWGPILLDVVCEAVTYMMRKAAQQVPPLVYRGVVAAGELALDGDGAFLVGPAIDEAAELMQLAQGAFVWLAPSARAIPTPHHPPDWWATMGALYPVPLKQGGAFNTIALSPYIENPNIDTITADERRQIRAGYEKAMSDLRIDVQLKRQNTLRFLDYLDQHQRPHRP